MINFYASTKVYRSSLSVFMINQWRDERSIATVLAAFYTEQYMTPWTPQNIEVVIINDKGS